MKHDLSLSVSPPATLAGVIERLGDDPKLTAQARREMASAVNMVAKFAQLPASSVSVDIVELRRILETVQPRRHRLSARRLTNIRSLFVQALVRSGAEVEPLRLDASLSEAWADLMGVLTLPNDRNVLARFSQWCSLRDIAPAAVDDDVIAKFHEALTTRSFVLKAERLVQSLVRGWNRSCDTISGWPPTRLSVINRREIFTLPVGIFPETFQDELNSWCDRLAGTDPLSEHDFKALRPVSVESHRRHILRSASALVHKGIPASEITGLHVLVEYEHAKQILRWFLERNDGKPSQQSHLVGGALMAIARHWTKLDDKALSSLEASCRKCRVKSNGMTRKNRDTLRVFEDEVLVRELLSLPGRLMRRALSGSEVGNRDAYLASQALAIAILINAPVRIENLANIDLERNVVRRGKGRNATVSLYFPAHEVKNDQEIELPLSPESTHLFDTYLQRARPRLAGPGCRSLFPGSDGSARSKIALGMAIAKTTERELGVRVSAHQFRHLAGFLFLKACPGEFETVRVLLGHKSLQTTVQFYAGMEIAAAANRYDEVVLAPSRKRSCPVK